MSGSRSLTFFCPFPHDHTGLLQLQAWYRSLRQLSSCRICPFHQEKPLLLFLCGQNCVMCHPSGESGASFYGRVRQDSQVSVGFASKPHLPQWGKQLVSCLTHSVDSRRTCILIFSLQALLLRVLNWCERAFTGYTRPFSDLQSIYRNRGCQQSRKCATKKEDERE